MAEELQNLLEKIKRDGVDKANADPYALNLGTSMGGTTPFFHSGSGSRITASAKRPYSS